MSYTRFALYAVPDSEELADFGARWLGWDIRSGAAVDQFAVAGLDDVTVTPRKYGFHGTIKPPFRLDATGVDALQQAVAALAADAAPVATAGLRLATLGKFLALVPGGDTAPLGALAARCVRDLDHFRAPPTPAELERRRAAGLTVRQEANLSAWGYPYVMDDFRFHMTLTGQVAPKSVQFWSEAARGLLPAEPVPFTVDRLALVGERQDGWFETIHTYALTG